jgi:hypothetical protein
VDGAKRVKKDVIRNTIPGLGQPPPSGGAAGAALDFGCLEHPPKKDIQDGGQISPAYPPAASAANGCRHIRIWKTAKKITFLLFFLAKLKQNAYLIALYTVWVSFP